MNLNEAAERLRALHTGPDPLVLPSVWDAASTRLVLVAGFPAMATTMVTRILEAGAVGCNLEDTDHSAGQTLRDAAAHADRLTAFKRDARDAGVDIVLNARVDVFLRQAESDTPPVDKAIRLGDES